MRSLKKTRERTEKLEKERERGRESARETEREKERERERGKRDRSSTAILEWALTVEFDTIHGAVHNGGVGAPPLGDLEPELLARRVVTQVAVIGGLVAVKVHRLFAAFVVELWPVSVQSKASNSNVAGKKKGKALQL